MSGRPPPPCPPNAATAALTRSTALTRSSRSGVTPAATLARPSLIAISAAIPLPTRLFIASISDRKFLGSRPSTTWPKKAYPATCSGPAASGAALPPPMASAFLASANSRSSLRRSSISAAIRAGTSSGLDLSMAATSRRRASRWTSHCRAPSPVSASIRRMPDDTALSAMTLKIAMSPSASTCVPPHNSTE